jgi:hypothetical protein
MEFFFFSMLSRLCFCIRAHFHIIFFLLVLLRFRSSSSLQLLLVAINVSLYLYAISTHVLCLPSTLSKFWHDSQIKSFYCLFFMHFSVFTLVKMSPVLVIWKWTFNYPCPAEIYKTYHLTWIISSSRPTPILVRTEFQDQAPNWLCSSTACHVLQNFPSLSFSRTKSGSSPGPSIPFIRN